MRHDDSTLKRKCQGIWIPIEIWENEKLTIQEKVLLTEIQSFDHGEGCWASNNHFSKFLNLTKDRAGRLVSSLVQKGFVISRCVYAEGSKQIVRRYLKVSNNGKCPITPTGKNTATPTGEFTDTPTGENTVDIKIIKNNKKEKDFSSPAAQDERDDVSEKKKLQIKVADRVIQTLNKMTGKKYQNTQANRKHILARLNEGYKLKDFIQVIRTKKQDPYFINNPKYMRPETLFGTKFDTYLNESPEEYSEETQSTTKSDGAAIPVKRPWSAATTKPYEDFLEDPSPANLAQLYRNLQGIEKWVQGIDFEHYQRHTVVYNYYRRWKDYADKLLEWVNDQRWIGKHPSVFDVNGKIWKQFHSKYILPEIFMRDKIKMTWDKY